MNNYSAPQKPEAASCGLRKCKICGGFFVTNIANKKICSDKCKKKDHCLNSKKYRKKYPEKIKKQSRNHYLKNKNTMWPIYRKRFIEKHPEKLKEIQKISSRNYYLKNKEKISNKNRTRRKYSYEYRFRVAANIERYRKNHLDKYREQSTLMRWFGKSKIPIACKKIIAIRTALKKGILKETINRIAKGETYAAYL